MGSEKKKNKKNEKNKKSRLVDILIMLISLTLLISGGYIIYDSLQGEPNEEEIPPTLSEKVVAEPDQEPVGPSEAEVDLDIVESDAVPPQILEAKEKKLMGPEDMRPGQLLLPSIGSISWVDNTKGRGTIAKNNLVLPPAKKVTRWVDGANVTDPDGLVLIAGHVSYNGTRGALFKAANLKPGTRAFLSDADGNIAEFQLISLDPVKKSALPTSVWEPEPGVEGKTMRIVTCGGKLRKTSNGSYSFDSNLIATYKEILPEPEPEPVPIENPEAPVETPDGIIPQDVIVEENFEELPENSGGQ